MESLDTASMPHRDYQVIDIPCAEAGSMNHKSRRARLVALFIGAACVVTAWAALSAAAGSLSSTSLASSLRAPRQMTTRFVTPMHTQMPMRRCSKMYATEDVPKLNAPNAPSLKAPPRPSQAAEGSTEASSTSGAWKAMDEKEIMKQEQIRIKADAERKQMERAETIRKLRDARREVRDFSNSLNDLYDDELTAQLPAGIVAAKSVPEDKETIIGFNPYAELLNSRAAMMGFLALLLVEGVTGKGILTFIGLQIGNGIDVGL